MLFYKVTAIHNDERWIEEDNDRRMKRTHTRKIALKSEQFNRQNAESGFYFISDMENGEIVCGVIAPNPDDIIKHVKVYFNMLGVKADNLQAEETTFSSLCTLLSRADRGDYIDDEDKVLERFELNKIKNDFDCRIDYGEDLVDLFVDPSRLYENSENLLANETLAPELDRIYSGKSKSKAFGHPVHYFVETGDRETRKKLYRTLLQALYNCKRVKSRRYCFIDFRPGQHFSHTAYDILYKNCIDGAMVVRYDPGDDTQEEQYASSERETIAVLCENMMKYRNRVLTVFCLPRVCEKTKNLFYEYLGSVGMVEIKEDLADAEKSAAYLKLLAKEQHIRPDQKLFATLEAEKKYLPEELRAIFEEWYNSKMKTVIFPQYRDICLCRKLAAKEVARGNAFDDLQEMVGLENAKDVIGKALNYYKLQKLYKDKGIKQDRPAMHMVFTGNPGTAKTTVARLFARIMRENGLLSKGHLVEVGRSDLVGRYVGWTAQIVKDKFKSAMGGVLFIDEAYSLVEDQGGLFGDEAINTIVQEMENRREDLVVIFAGYPNEMEQFLNKNPGLRSRIAFHVPFADYTAHQLCQIAELIGKSKGITLTDGAIKKLSVLFETARQQHDFGNGRYVRNIIELSKMNQANRLLTLDPEEVTKNALITLEEADIEVPVAKAKPEKRKIGFGA